MRVYFSLKYCQVIESVKIFIDVTHSDLYILFLIMVVILSVLNLLAMCIGRDYLFLNSIEGFYEY